MYTIKEMTKADHLYCYSENSVIDKLSGCIGHLRADFGCGTEFWSTWWDHCDDLKTDRFRKELDMVINALRFNKDKDILKNRTACLNFCCKHPNALLEDRRSYGFRIDTDQFTYMLRLNPRWGEYDLYCYCYVKETLCRHMANSANGICFTDSNHKETFRIPDGGKIHIDHPDGKTSRMFCRYVDEENVDIGIGKPYPIRQLVEDLCGNGFIFSPAEKED